MLVWLQHCNYLTKFLFPLALLYNLATMLTEGLPYKNYLLHSGPEYSS